MRAKLNVNIVLTCLLLALKSSGSSSFRAAFGGLSTTPPGGNAFGELNISFGFAAFNGLSSAALKRLGAGSGVPNGCISCDGDLCFF